MKLTLIVRDTPRPGGSHTPFINRKTGKMFVAPANPNTKTWRDSVRAAAFEQYHGKPTGFPLEVWYEFIFKRPQSHFSASKERKLKATAPKFHLKKPDGTKLMRSTEDALTGIIWIDDALIVKSHPYKRYAIDDELEACRIEIRSLEEE
jgi:Holliday junction resolvase RusA-like endonuclease